MKLSKKYLFFMILSIILALAINGYIIMHSCLNATESSKASAGVTDLIKNFINFFKHDAINDSNYGSFSTFIRKAFGHFGLFAVSGLLTSLAIYLSLSPYSWCKPYMNVMFSLVFGLFMGLLTEIIQLGVPGRSGEITDVLIDFSGYLVGTFIMGLILFLVIRKLRKNKRA